MVPDRPAILDQAIAAVPAGAWAVGVSGGADSVALLRLLSGRADLRLHVAHLDHEARGIQSEEDARFVQSLAREWGVPCTAARLSQVEPKAGALPANRSARFRAIRFRMFRDVCERQALGGVILAHHAMDQAETILQRLLRGSGPAGLGGMRPRSQIAGLTVLRPLLGVHPDRLREYLIAAGQGWREDVSNQSPAYQRNRVRAVLKRHPSLVEDLLEFGKAMGELHAWVGSAAPKLGERFAALELGDCPDILAHEAARRWLAERGVVPDDLLPSVTARLIEMARDAASPARQHFPGRLLVGRKKGMIGPAGSKGLLSS